MLSLAEMEPDEKPETLMSSGRADAQRTGRREFIAGLGAGLLAAAGARLRGNPAARGRTPAVPDWTYCIFSKHLQWLDYRELGVAVSQLGFDGIDLTVRPTGHVLPEKVRTDLPRAVSAVAESGVRIPTITTAITRPEDAGTREILETASGLGIPFYRLVYYRYPEDKELSDTLAEIRRSLTGLADINRRFRICGDYQNHAGASHFGAALWDLRAALEGLPRRWLGCQFDIRHATVEGGLAWPTNFRALAGRIHTVVVKDFRWKETRDGWRVENCPLGEGMVPVGPFLALLLKSGFAGPISLHCEYSLGGAERGRRRLTMDRDRVLESIGKDLATLKRLVREALVSVVD